MSRMNAGFADQSRFAVLPRADVRRSRFDRTCTYKTTFDSGKLIPFYLDEVLPGDTFELNATLFGRLTNPLIQPIMDDLFIDTQFFFVPSRLVWDHWVNLNGERDNPDDTIEYVVPIINSGEDGFEVGSIADYFGIPTGVPNLDVSALPFRAYNLIYNEWYRDENLIDRVPFNKDDTNDNKADYKVLKRGKRKDYYTSSLPWPQKGPGLEIPLGNFAPVVGNGNALGMTNGYETGAMYGANGGSAMVGTPYTLGVQLPGINTEGVRVLEGNYTLGVSTDPELSGLVADLSKADPVTINTFRTAFQMQMVLELDARGGTRYFEMLRAHFGVMSPDARLQRPEYLGGSSTMMNVNSVAQTSGTGRSNTSSSTTTYYDSNGEVIQTSETSTNGSSEEISAQGNLAAYGIFTDQTPKFTKSFVEHGYIIGIVSVRSNLTYQQGLQRMFSRRTRYDFYLPVLAHLGEQAILNKEIYAQGNDVLDEQGNVVDDKVFGYQEHWSEYRYGFNKITGKLRSSDPQSLDVWHLSQDFANLPVLGKDFIEENVPLNRVLSVTDEPEILFDSRISVYCTRPMPTYSVPGLITHF